MSDPEVPEPDAFEAALAVVEDPEVPEADALEQAREEPLDEDDGLR